MPVPSVFLSSTFADFRREREMIIDVLPFVDVHTFCAERMASTGSPMHIELTRRIDKADMVVLLLGTRYGTEAPSGESWTATEVQYALSRNKRVFAYIRECLDPVSQMVDIDRRKAAKLQRFQAQIEREIALIPRYKLPDYHQLIAMVVRDVQKYALELEEEAQALSYAESHRG